MKSIFAKYGRTNSAETFDAPSRSQSGLATKTKHNIGFMRVLLLSILGSSGIAHAQFCPQNFDGVGAPTLP